LILFPFSGGGASRPLLRFPFAAKRRGFWKWRFALAPIRRSAMRREVQTGLSGDVPIVGVLAGVRD
jgi:hypothetical protein